MFGGVRSKKFELILKAAAEIFARQPPPADLPFLTISSFSSPALLDFARLCRSWWQILFVQRSTIIRCSPKVNMGGASGSKAEPDNRCCRIILVRFCITT